MQEISKEFIDQLLHIVNLDADSKVRSKSGYGRFIITELFSNLVMDTELGDDKIQFTLEYNSRETKQSTILLRKVYDLTRASYTAFKSQFYQEVIRYLTGHPDSHKLIQYGKQN